jgi:hypothetical protein
MITNDELKDYVEGRFIEADKHVEICTELLALREQTRRRKYPDEKPEVGQAVWGYCEDETYCECMIDADNNWRNVHNFLVYVIWWQPLPSAPDAKGGE